LYPFIVETPASVYALLLACKQTNDYIGILGEFTAGPVDTAYSAQWVGNDKTRFVRQFNKNGTATIHNPGHWAVGCSLTVRRFEAPAGLLPKSVIYTNVGGNMVALPVDGTGWEGVKHPDLYYLTPRDNVPVGTTVLSRYGDGAADKWFTCTLSAFEKGGYAYVRFCAWRQN